jgi:hypothetical protein
MDICVKIIFFKILTTLDNFGANYQNTHLRDFFCSLGWFTSIFVKKLQKTFFGEFWCINNDTFFAN